MNDIRDEVARLERLVRRQRATINRLNDELVRVKAEKLTGPDATPLPVRVLRFP